MSTSDEHLHSRRDASGVRFMALVIAVAAILVTAGATAVLATFLQ